ncbi:carbon-nitrogen hydrolase [Trichoderma citrinoviride]|uniref:Carbon-nitrogen hydrolase n=1 Tax=Trichoderma citrinoviride TaxID=58853 RepID=A0A2T4B2V7_9HYPO|nr:carbon-nitrogen hydrolase [Trichoderma citrinoviride]PTB63659.1 carbon-nitrogen hydrolase [Trichoderma citrinoviride]
MTIRVGTASPNTQPTTPLTLSLLHSIASRAAAQRIDILLLPEAFIGGYPRGTAFGCVVGSRTAEGREAYARYFDQAIDLGDTVGDGSAGAGLKWVRRELPGYEQGGAGRGDGSREELERIARDTGVFYVTGCIEKAGGSLYCAAVYVCPKEGIIGKRRKVMPTGTERLIWAQGHPSTLRAVSTFIRGQRINLAAAICWENYMPLVRQALYAQNINLYLAPTADGREGWLSLMRTIGVEGRCFVVSSNMCVRGDEADGTDAGDRDVVPVAGGFGGARRSSAVVMDDGFEFAVPPPKVRHGRRKSVFDEDGNEIVLSCPADNGDVQAEDEAEDQAHAQAKAQAQAQEQQKQKQLPKVTEDDTTQNQQPASVPKAPVFLSRGGSSIVSPFGDVLAGPQWEDEDNLIYADIDLRDCIRGRLDLDTAGSYSRNDAFKLTVDGLDLDPLPY